MWWIQRKTSRVTLRRFKATDAADYFTYAKIPGLGEAAGWRHLENFAEAEEALYGLIHVLDAFAIEDRQTLQVIGHLTIQATEKNNPFEKEIGFVLHPAFRQQGIMFEVLTVIVSELFATGVQKIYASCFEDNIPSKKLIEKLGFRFEKIGSYTSVSLQQTFSTLDYFLTWEEYNGGKSERII